MPSIRTIPTMRTLSKTSRTILLSHMLLQKRMHLKASRNPKPRNIVIMNHWWTKMKSNWIHKLWLLPLLKTKWISTNICNARLRSRTKLENVQFDWSSKTKVKVSWSVFRFSISINFWSTQPSFNFSWKKASKMTKALFCPAAVLHLTKKHLWLITRNINQDWSRIAWSRSWVAKTNGIQMPFWKQKLFISSMDHHHQKEEASWSHQLRREAACWFNWNQLILRTNQVWNLIHITMSSNKSEKWH